MKSLLHCESSDLLRKTPIQTQFAIESWFGSMARELIFKSTLIAGGNQYQITEVEFYYYSDVHQDPFCRRTEAQLGIGKWCFHRKGKSYREGNYRGLDISFGGDCYGGLLLRSIRKGEEVIEGPCLVVNELLSALGANSVTELVEQADFDDDIFEGSLRLVSDSQESTPLYQSARYGLVAKGSAYLPFLIAPYRYATRLHHLKKGIQNFVLELFSEGYSLGELGLITGCNHVIYNGWILAFIEGYRRNEPPVFGQRLSVSDASRTYGYCKRNF